MFDPRLGVSALSAEFSLYGAKAAVSLDTPTSVYTGVSINTTVLYPAWITSLNGDLHLDLAASSVQTLDNLLVVSLSGSEFSSVLHQIWTPGFVFSTLTLHFGNGSSVLMTTYCLFVTLLF